MDSISLLRSSSVTSTCGLLMPRCLYSGTSNAGMISKAAVKRSGSPSCACRSVTRGCETGVSPWRCVSACRVCGMSFSTTSCLISPANCLRMSDAGTLPLRKPGMRASFWYLATICSVSLATTSAGTSAVISRSHSERCGVCSGDCCSCSSVSTVVNVLPSLKSVQMRL